MNEPKPTTKQDDDLRRFTEAWQHLTYWQRKEILFKVIISAAIIRIKRYIGSIPWRWFMAVYSMSRPQLGGDNE